MTWFKVDDKFHDHPKARRAGKSAIGVWLLAGTWCADHLTDGFVPAHVLTRWGTRADAQRLVDAGLWEADELNGETGWRFVKWEKYQPTREAKKAQRAVRAAAGRVGGLASGRARAKQHASTNHEADAKQVASPVVEPPTRPDPSSSSTSPDQSPPHGHRGLTDENLQAIVRRLRCTADHAARVVDDILDRAGTEVGNPWRYVVRAIDADPARFAPTRTAGRAAEHCPTHPGQPAGNCGGCVADARAAS